MKINMNKNFTFLFLVICVACQNGETRIEQDSPEEAIITNEVNLTPIKDSMDHYISGYQNWTVNNEIYDTISEINIYWDTNFIIIEESNVTRTFTIAEKTFAEKSELPKEHGGILVRTVYKLEADDNETDYDELVVFNSEFTMMAYQYEYIINFTLSGKGIAKSYYSNKAIRE